jgi:hypothetical protein
LNRPWWPPTAPMGVNSPWRMFPYDHNSVSGKTGPSKSNQEVKTTETEHFLKMTHFEVFWGPELAPPTTPNRSPWCTNLTIIVFFCLKVPFQYSGAIISAQSVNLEKGCIWHVRGPLKGSQQPPTAPMGVRNPWGMPLYDNDWFLVVETLSIQTVCCKQPKQSIFFSFLKI